MPTEFQLARQRLAEQQAEHQAQIQSSFDSAKSALDKQAQEAKDIITLKRQESDKGLQMEVRRRTLSMGLTSPETFGVAKGNIAKVDEAEAQLNADIAKAYSDLGLQRDTALTSLASEVADNYADIDVQEASWKDANIEVNGGWVSKDYYNTLTADDQALVVQLGTGAFNTLIDERNKKAQADQELWYQTHVYVPEQQGWVDKTAWEARLAELATLHKLPNGEYVDKAMYDGLSAEDRALLSNNGIDKFNATMKAIQVEIMPDGKVWVYREGKGSAGVGAGWLMYDPKDPEGSTLTKSQSDYYQNLPYASRRPWEYQTSTESPTATMVWYNPNNGITWVRINNEWQLYDPNDPAGSVLTKIEAEDYRKQAQIVEPVLNLGQQPTEEQPPVTITAGGYVVAGAEAGVGIDLSSFDFSGVDMSGTATESKPEIAPIKITDQYKTFKDVPDDQALQDKWLIEKWSMSVDATVEAGLGNRWAEAKRRTDPEYAKQYDLTMQGLSTKGISLNIIDTFKEAISLGKIQTATYNEKGIAEAYNFEKQRLTAIYNGDEGGIINLHTMGKYATEEEYLSDRQAAIDAGTGEKSISLEQYIKQTVGTQEEHRATILQGQPSGGLIVKEIALTSIPVYGTMRTWNKVGTGGKVSGVALDALWVLPFVGGIAGVVRSTWIPINTARSLATMTALGRAKTTYKAVKAIAVAEVKAPLTAITHPIATAKSALSPIETMLRGKKLPIAGLEIKYSPQRIPVVGSIEEMQSLRNAVTNAAIKGEKAVAKGVSGIEVELHQPMALGNLRPAVIHGTPDVTPYRSGVIVGASGDRELFTAPSLYTRFSVARSSGQAVEGGERGLLLIRDERLLKELQESTKVYKGTMEVEKTIPKGIDLGKPVQELMTRDAAGEKLTVLVYGKKLSNVEIAKFKLVGTADTVKDLFAPNMAVRTAGVAKGAKSAELTSELSDLERELDALGYEGRSLSAAESARAVGLLTRINAIRDKITDLNAGGTEYAVVNVGDTSVLPYGRNRTGRGESDVTISPTMDGEIVLASSEDSIALSGDERGGITPDYRGLPSPPDYRFTPLTEGRIPPPVPEGRTPPPVPEFRTPPPVPRLIVPPTGKLPPKVPKKSGKWRGEPLSIGTAVWRQGELGEEGDMWWIVPPPYDKKYYQMGEPPEGVVKVAEGKGSAYESIQIIGGVIYDNVKVDLGWADILITPDKNGKAQIKFSRDPNLVYQGKSRTLSTLSDVEQRAGLRRIKVMGKGKKETDLNEEIPSEYDRYYLGRKLLSPDLSGLLR